VEQALTLARKAADLFKEKGIPNARLDAELILAHVLQIDRLKLYLQHDRPVTPPELERFRELVRRRLKREPVQYIVGTVAFRQLELAVDARALIPRPETELLVGEVLKWAASGAGMSEAAAGMSEAAAGMSEAAAEGREMAALDIGTGTGAIALSLAAEGGFRVVATDVSEAALSLAAENAERTSLVERVDLRLGASWGPVRNGEVFDVIVSNPPYIGEQERTALAAEVVDYEPAGALFAQDGGLAVLSEIIEGASGRLRPGGLLALEMGETQGAQLVARIEAAGEYGTARVIRDYAGRERIVMAERK
jgi:release factor glutamine methyltransferase